MNVKILTEDPVAIASRCLEAELHNGRLNGTLFDTLETIWDGHEAGRHLIVAAEVDGVLIGCATLHKRSKQISVFVANDYRRKGIGSRLIEELEKLSNVSRSKFLSRPGDENGERFFDAVRVIYYPDGYSLTAEETRAVFEKPEMIGPLMAKKREEYRRDWENKIRQG